MRSVVLLGPGSGIGRRILQKLQEDQGVRVTCVVRDRGEEGQGRAFWDFASPLPRPLLEADVVINCARSPNYAFNVVFNRRLYRELPPSVLFINFSSNCIYAKPRNGFARWLFKGDGYIREKKAIERAASARSRSVLLRPTIVAEEGGWARFLAQVRQAPKVTAPSYARSALVKVISADSVAHEVLRCLQHEGHRPPRELFAEVVPLVDFLGVDARWDGRSRTYFESALKNLLLHLLNAWILPDALVYALQGRLPQGAGRAPGEPRPFVIDGMTRLYLSGEQTRRGLS